MHLVGKLFIHLLLKGSSQVKIDDFHFFVIPLLITSKNEKLSVSLSKSERILETSPPCVKKNAGHEFRNF